MFMVLGSFRPPFRDGQPQWPGLSLLRWDPTMVTEGFDMGNQENADVVRRGYEAFISGDMEALRGLFADDAVWHVSGSGGLAGDKLGRDAIMAYFGELFSRSDSTVKVELQDVIAGDRHTVGLQRAQAQRNGKSLAQQGAIVFTLQDGKITEVIEFQEDTAKSADFWS